RDPGHHVAQEHADEHVHDDDDHQHGDRDVRHRPDPRPSPAHGARMVKLPRLEVKARWCAPQAVAGRGATLNEGGRLMRGRLFGVAMVLLVAAALSGGRSPAAGQAKPGVKKLDLPHVTAPPESSAVGFKWMCEELT